MRAVHLAGIGSLGGAELSVLDTILGIQAVTSEWAFTVIAPAEGELACRARELGIDVQIVPMPRTLTRVGDSALVLRSGLRATVGLMLRMGPAVVATAQYGVALKRALASHAPDVVHTHGLKPCLLSAVCVPRSASLVWHIRDFYGSRLLARRALRALGARCDAAIAISRSVADDARHVFDSAVPIHAVHNGIDVAYLAASRGSVAELDRLAGFPGADEPFVRVGLIATYARWKGHDVFLRAVRSVLAQAKRNVRFFIIGGPIYGTEGSQFEAAELVYLARELGVEKHVGFVGHQQDVRPVLAALDVVVHASTRPEPFGRTIAEAMAAGKAVVASAAGGARELFTPEQEALGVSCGDEPALAQAILRLVEDESLRLRLGRAAQAAAVGRFRRERLGSDVLQVYRSVLQSPQGAGSLHREANRVDV